MVDQADQQEQRDDLLAQISPEFAAEVRAIQAARGSVLTWEEFAELVASGTAMAAAADGASADAGPPQHGLLARTVTVPGTAVVLRSPTLGARSALRRATGWLEAATITLDWYHQYCAYVLAHAHNGDALAAVALRTEAERVLDDWSLRLTCEVEDIEWAIDALAQDTLPPADGSGAAQKKTVNPTMPGSSSTSSSTQAAPLPTGSTRSPRATSSGSCAPSPHASASAPTPPAAPATNAAHPTPKAPRSAPPAPTSNSGAD